MKQLHSHNLSVRRVYPDDATPTRVLSMSQEFTWDVYQAAHEVCGHAAAHIVQLFVRVWFPVGSDMRFVQPQTPTDFITSVTAILSHMTTPLILVVHHMYHMGVRLEMG